MVLCPSPLAVRNVRQKCTYPLLSAVLFVVALALGSLPPPPASLTSVPLATGAPTGTAVSSPLQPTHVSWATTMASMGPPINQPPIDDMASLPGLLLSPAEEPFPKKLVDKIRGGNFVEMKELLPDNLALITQLESMQGLSAAHLLGAARPRLREVSSLQTWCYCFLGYMAIRAADPTTRDQLAYARLLIKEAQRHGGLGWLDYDRAFRQQVAIDPSLRWNTLSPGLHASTMLNQGVFCTLCREVDHTRAQCALSCLQQPATETTAAPRTTQQQLPIRRRPESAPRICISWNKGSCLFHGRCTYRHVCATCQALHRARDCTQTPHTSMYTHRPGPPRQESA